MTKRLMLSLPLKDFDALHEAAEGRGKFCRVSKAQLSALLIDHSRTVAALGEDVEDAYQDSRHVRKADNG